MATRSVIARKTPTGFAGVYSHCDGYPSGVGASIWAVLNEKFLGNKGKVGVQNDGEATNAIEAFCKIYIDGHKGGWSAFPDKCYCHDENFVMRDGQNDATVDEKSVEPLHHEYVYIIDPQARAMTIWAMKSREDLRESTKDTKIYDEAKTLAVEDGMPIKDYGHCCYGYRKLAVIALTDAFEPLWEKLESSDD